MITETDIRRLRTEAEAAKNQHAQAVGALEQLKKQLVDDWGLKSIKEAEARLEELEKKEVKLAAKLEDMVDQYKKEWEEAHAT